MRSKLTRRGKMLVAMLVFVLTSSFAVVTNGLMQGGINLNYSISRYVGLATVSAVIFAIGNFVVTDFMAERLYGVGRALKMPKLFYWVVVVMAVALIGLSVCPVGYFDLAPGVESIPSLVHQVCSRVMFVCMLLTSTWLALHSGVTKWAKLWCVLYTVYAVICAVGFILEFEWFISWILIFESCYLLWFMILITNLKCKGLEESFIRKVGGERDAKSQR